MSEVVRGTPFAVLKNTWPLVAIATTISLLGVLTMDPFGTGSAFASHQLLSIGIGIAAYFFCCAVDFHFIRRTPVIIAGYIATLILLSLLLVLVHPVLGAKSWFAVGPFSFQPTDPAKLVLIALIAKYFSRRHIEIGQFWHLIVSGTYAGALMLLILVEPDLGTAAIFGIVWFGMVLVSGISKKNLAVMVMSGVVLATGLWFFGLHDYQRARIVNFVNPAADIHGSGYNAYQAVVATGSGELWGKGIGYGTQSKLRFLPEYQSDFVFAAFAEEWGFIGVGLVLVLYGLLFMQLLSIARHAATNFDALFTIGVLLLFAAQLTIHAGINFGLLPVTGTTTPFMSYGGSHVLIEFLALGIVASLTQHARSVPREAINQEYFG